MGRIRTIKPEFFTSLDMAEHDLFTRLVFIGLWTHCDDYGRCQYEPRLIHAALFPLESGVSPEDLRRSLEALHTSGQVLIYGNGGRAYLEVVKWADHQRVSHPGKDRLPASGHPDSHPLESFAKVSGESRETLVPEQGTGNRDIRAPAQSDGFDEFWNQYPRKLAKKRSQMAWRNLNNTDRNAALEALPAHVNAWRNVDPKHIPHPTTWLHGRRWEDELAATGTNTALDGGGYHGGDW